MKEYKDLLTRVLEEGVNRPDRTGIGSRFIPGAFLQFDMADGFPAVTTKPLYFKQVVGEMIGFLRGYENAAQFRELGCTIWDKNANDHGPTDAPNQWLRPDSPRKGKDDLGRIYGAQWRTWRAGEGLPPVDQVWEALRKLRTTPNDRRMIVSAWRPDELGKMALPPCHVLHHYLVDTENGTLHMNMFQRSVDTVLGLPFNVAEYALLLHIVSALTGYTPGRLGMFLSDVHVYMDHLPAVHEQLMREPMRRPTLRITGPLADSSPGQLLAEYGPRVFDIVAPEDFSLENYEHYPKLMNPTPMAV